ncbi:MAG: outer membrane protein transport protein [bacterium]|nr:outer membrane protein transport protein [bacterium]
MKWTALRTITVAAALLAPPAHATNGMNMEGYGPVSSALGGAGIAFDSGTAALMINPATLMLQPGATTRLDVAFGYLGPDVSASVRTPMGTLQATSLADAYFMPAFGWITRKGDIAYGFGVFAQGGMGTEYGPTSWLADPSQGQNTALTIGLVNQSEVSVGRALVPLAYQLNERLSIGATVDLVWAGLDLQMAMSEAQFVDLASTQQAGTVSGSLTQVFGALYEPFGGTGIRRLHHAYFDFANDSQFTGQSRGAGLGGKLGVVYEVATNLTLGAVYHTQTAISDLETSAASMRMAVNVDIGLLTTGIPNGQYVDMDLPVRGEITIEDFQWPATYGLGVAYGATDDVRLVADVKRIQWSAVMEDFTMVFKADAVAENGAFGGQELKAVLFQDWEDQTVLSLGAEWQASPAVTLRAGFNYGSNPVPDSFLNALFPAIVENHATIGLGYELGARSSVNISIMRGFNSKATNPGNGVTVPSVTSAHAQLNSQLMYTYWLN